AASLADDFVDGAWFVDLAPVSDATQVLARISATPGLRGQGSEGPPQEPLHLYLRERKLLLTLDNCEHVLGAAPAVAGLLDACPDVVILATSREPLRVRWERLYPLEPLPTPPPGQYLALGALEAIPSVALFVRR